MTEHDVEWLTYLQAAERLGVVQSTVRSMLRRGELRRRPGKRSRRFPSVDPVSVEEWRVVLEQERAEAAERAARRAEAGKPPDNDHNWLSSIETAELLGLSRKWVSLRAREERIPAIWHGGRWWVRRDHAELVRSARVARLCG